jgi:UDP-N-acetyl-D-mannosaminuronic acid transferase (WecB/TagA/CpsF family)
MGFITMTIQIIDSEGAVNFIQARRETGVVLSALNLFMLGFLRKHPEFPNNAVFWCDGLMGALYMRLKGGSTKRLRGVEMLKAALAANKGRSACILGSCSDSAKKSLAQHGVVVAQHYSLDSLNLDNFDFSSMSLSSDFVLVTLPSPKQELLSLKLADVPTNSNKHFYCIGGALNMLSHPELDCPKYLQVLGLEFVFRLRTDTARRINRLFQSFFGAVRNVRGLASYKVVVINR